MNILDKFILHGVDFEENTNPFIPDWIFKLGNDLAVLRNICVVGIVLMVTLLVLVLIFM